MIGMNENQNAFLKEGRTTSRVTNEPGGKSSISLGWDSPKATEPRKATNEKENCMQIVGSAAASQPKAATNNASIDQKGTNAPGGSRAVSSNMYANGSSQNTGNVITDRPTTLVTQPPGGRSSISFC